MQIMKKPVALVVSMVLIFSLSPMTVHADGPIEGTVYEVSNDTDLTAALRSLADGDTIRLLNDIDYSSGILITGISVTFDVGVHTLNIRSDSGTALCVTAIGENPGEVMLTGSGELNVTSIGDSSIGLFVGTNSRATVTSALADGFYGKGVYAYGDGTITVEEDVVAKGENSNGAFTESGGHVTVNGSIKSYGDGSIAAYSVFEDSLIEVGHDAVASGSAVYGVFVYDGGAVNIANDVQSDGGSAWCVGAYMEKGGTITIGGDVEAGSGEGSIAADAKDFGTLTVNGSAIAHGKYAYGVRVSDTCTVRIEQSVSVDGESCTGVAAGGDAAEAIVGGNVSASGDWCNGAGIYENGTISISGNLSAVGDSSFTADIQYSGTVTVDGFIISPIFIRVNDALKEAKNAVPGSGSYADYVEFRDGASVLRLKAPKPTITSQPADVVRNIGQSATFTVEATAPPGGAISYQWQKSTDGGKKWTNLGGEIKNTYTVRNITTYNDGNKFHCIVKNSMNGIANSLDSSAATLTVNTAAVPTIITQPSNTTKAIGKTAVFTIEADASDEGDLSYQWRKKGTYLWKDVDGATNSALIIGPLVNGDKGQYLCVVTNKKYGDSKSLDSSVAVLTVVTPAAIPTIQTHPASLTVISGSSAVFEISATVSDGGDLTYQWEKSTDGGTNWNTISEATGTALAIARVAIGDSGSKYRCAVTNNKNGDSNSINSSAATLTVDLPPKILVSIFAPAPITGLANGTAKSTSDLGLPTEITLETDSGTVSASVNWDVAGCTYDPSSAGAQTFDITGTAILPTGVVNPNSVPMTIRISVSVIGKPGGKTHKPDILASITSGEGMIDSLAVNVSNGSALVSLNRGDIKIVMPEVRNVNQYALELPASILNSQEEGKQIEMFSKIGTILIPDDMLRGAEIGNPEKVRISIGVGDKSGLSQEIKDKIGDKPVVELKLSAGDKAVAWNNPDAPVTVSIPYKPTAEELKDPEHIVVWYLDGEGNLAEVPSGRYNAETGMVSFSTTHFSRYSIAYVTKTFDDLGTAVWARKPVEVLASKGILEGLSETRYAPKTNITRADFLCFLIRTLSIEANFEENFDGIASEAYYYREIGIAKELGITAGAGKNRFDPDANISRQDMMVMTERTLKLIDKIEQENESSRLGKFSDNNKISAYAKVSVDTMVKEELITGSGGRINPRGNTTRAEAAVFLYRIYEKYGHPVR